MDIQQILGLIQSQNNENNLQNSSIASIIPLLTNQNIPKEQIFQALLGNNSNLSGLMSMFSNQSVQNNKKEKNFFDYVKVSDYYNKLK